MINNFFHIIRSQQKNLAQSLLIVLACNLTGCTLLQAEESRRETYSKLAQLYLPSLVKEEILEQQQQENIKKENQKIILDTRPNALAQVKVSPIGDVEKLRMLYTIFSSNEKDDVADGVLNETVFTDLQFFTGGKQNLNEHLFASLNLTETKMGSIELQKILAYPTNDSEELTRRQTIVRELVENETLFTALDEKIKTIKNGEADFLWMWKTLDEEVEKYFNAVYYQWKVCQSWNKDDEMLEVGSLNATLFSPALTIGAPFVTVLWISTICVLIGWSLRQGNLLRGPFDGSIGHFIRIIVTELAKYPTLMFFYFLCYLVESIKSVHDATLNNDITNQIHERMIHVAQVTNSLHEMYSIIQSNTTLKTSASEIDAIKNLFTITPENSATYGVLSRLASSTFKGEPSFFSNRGKVLASYKIFRDVKHNVINSLKTAGKIDAYLSIAKLYKKFAQHPNAQFCFPNYINQTSPYINIDSYWHPILNPNKVVTNCIEQGQVGQARNVILTGPNAGGKSTNLKAITVALILAQTLGIAPAKAMIMTPFKLINTYLNIADTQGKESLFQAEMHRAQSLLDQVKCLKSTELAFVIMDEIFTGTNPQEGMAGAYGIAKKLSTYKNSMAVIATHFMVMTDLAHDTDGLFENYKVSVNRENGRITYPYTLEKGITDQAIALELLAQKGFDAEILQDAYNVINHKEEIEGYSGTIDQN